MKPWTIGSKENLLCSGALDRSHNIVKASNGRSVGVHVWVTYELVDHARVGSPVVGKAAEVGDDKVHIRELGREQVHHFRAAYDIYKERHAEGPGCFTEFPRRHGLEPVRLDAPKPPRARPFHHVENAAAVSRSVYKGKTNQLGGKAGNDVSNLPIGLVVIAVERSEDHCLVDARPPRAAQIRFDGRVCVPRRCHLIALAGMTMAVDDHVRHSSWRSDGREKSFISAAKAKYQIEVSIPRKKFCKLNFSLGPCA